MATEVTWNLEEGRGNVSQTEVVGPVLVLHLGLNQVRGPTVPVGTFRLNLLLLERDHFVRRRGRGFDVQINRETDGTYTIGLEKGRTTKLEAFRISSR